MSFVIKSTLEIMGEFLYRLVTLLIFKSHLSSQSNISEDCVQETCATVSKDRTAVVNAWNFLYTWRHTVRDRKICINAAEEVCKDWSGDTPLIQDTFEDDDEERNDLMETKGDQMNKSVFLREETSCNRKKCLKQRLRRLDGDIRDGEISGLANITYITGKTVRAYFRGGVQGGVWIEEQGGQVTGVGHVCSGQSWHWVDNLDSAVFNTETFEIIVFGDRPEIIYHIKKNSFGTIHDDIEYICDGNGMLFPDLDSLTKHDDEIDMLSDELLSHVVDKEKLVYKIVKALNILDNRGVENNIEKIGGEQWLRKHGELRDIPFQDQNLSDWKSCLKLLTYSIPDKLLLGTGLVSYPGSGNTWLRYLVEAATGLVTAVGGPAILTKTHHMELNTLTEGSEREDLWWRMKNIRNFSGRAILLIRNPVDAIRSWWNHNKDVTEEPIDQDIDTPRFTRFVEAELDRWRDTALDWILLADHLLVVHYEDLLADPLLQLKRIRTFLKLKEDKLRTKCVERSTFTAFKRVKKQNVKVKMNKMLKDKIIQDIWEIQNLLEHMGKKKMPIELFTKIIQNLT